MNGEVLHHLSLFSGYEGFGLGLHPACLNVRSIGYVEIDDYCQLILQARIRDGLLDWAPIVRDIRCADFRPMAGLVDIITAGFPCQPHSVAGARLGADDERNLWNGTSGRTRSESLATWDPASSCWRTCQASLLTGMAEPWSDSWARSGMTAAGRLYPLRKLEHPTGVTGGGALQHWPTPRATDGSKGGSPTNDNPPPEVKRWPTPMASDAERASTTYPKGNQTLEGTARELWPTPTVNGNNNRKGLSPNSGDGLATAARQWPMPAARDAKDSGTEPSQWARHTPGLSIQVQQWPRPRAHDANGAAPTEYDSHSPNLEALANRPTHRASRTGGADSHGQVPEAFRGGKVDPRWVEWLMGIPIGRTKLEPSATESYPQWWHGFCGS